MAVKTKGYIYGENPLRREAHGWPSGNYGRGGSRHRNTPSAYWMVMLALLVAVLAMGVYVARLMEAEARPTPPTGVLERPSAIPQGLRR